MAAAMTIEDEPERLLNLLPPELRVSAVNIITEVLSSLNDSNVTNPLDARIIEAVRLRLGTELNLRELTPNDVMLAIQDVMAAPPNANEAATNTSTAAVSAAGSHPPPPFVEQDISDGTPEQLVSYLFSLLRAHQHANDQEATVIAPVDVMITRVLHRISSMPHQKPLLRRVHAELRAMSGALADADQAAAAERGQHLMELVYNVILQAEGFTENNYRTQQPLGPLGRAMILQALDTVGIYVREDPFPEAPGAPAECRPDCTVYDKARNMEPMRNRHGGTDFEVAHNPRNGNVYIFAKTLKKAIYGSVRMALVADRNPAGNVVYDSINGVRVAVKCIEKRRIRDMKEKVKKKGKQKLNEDPLKEVRCLSYITRRLSGQLSGPENLRGDASRVLPVLDILENDLFIFVVMPLMQQEFFDVVDARGQTGTRFSGHEAWVYFSQLVAGLEVAHSLDLAHHDVSFENTMMDAEGKCIVIDWGMVVKVCRDDQGRPIKVAPADEWPLKCGKLLYHAPEFFTTRSFDPFKLDVWALGIMLFVLLTGVPPWSVQTGPIPSDRRFQCIINGRLQDLLSHWNIHLPPAAVELMQALLLGDPDQRPSLEEIRNFEWFLNQGR